MVVGESGSGSGSVPWMVVKESGTDWSGLEGDGPASESGAETEVDPAG